MSSGQQIYAALNVTAVTALVEDRIYPVIAPVGCGRPFAVWQRMGGDPLSVLGQASAARQFVDVALHACAETFDAAEALASAMREALIDAGAGRCTPPEDFFEPETKLVRVSFQARLFYRAS